MAATTTTTIVVTLVLTLACCVTSAPTPAPETAMAPSPESNGCFMALTNMSDCLTFVEEGSNLTKPDKGCCPALAGLLDSNPICLCTLLGKPETIGIKIDLNKAFKLPSVCNLTTPPVSACSAVGVPVSLPPSISEGSMSPSMAPGAMGIGPSAGTMTSPSPGGPGPSSNEASASPSQNNNEASSIQASALIFILGTLCVSVFF